MYASFGGAKWIRAATIKLNETLNEVFSVVNESGGLTVAA